LTSSTSIETDRTAHVRGEVWAKTNLEKLPAEEQALWRAFWADVEKLLLDARRE